MKNKRSILKAISMALVIALTLSNGTIVSNISYASYNGDSELSDLPSDETDIDSDNFENGSGGITDPAGSTDNENTGNAGDSETPENPENPEEPENPENPENSENPENPEDQENPEDSENPDDSEDSEQLEDPENPEDLEDLELLEELEEMDEEEELGASLVEHEIYGTATTSGECGAQGDNLIWAFYEEYKTLVISGEGAMQYGRLDSIANLDFNKLVIEDGVTTIGNYCFNNIKQIEEEIVFPASITSIGAGAFWSDNNIKSIVFNDATQTLTIGNDAFRQCSSLEEIHFPEELVNLTSGTNAYAYCSSLKELIVPGGLKDGALTSSMFSGMSYLEKLTIEEGITTIESGTFGVEYLVEVNLPDSLTVIPAKLFQNARKLTKINPTDERNVNLPKNIKRIGNYAFISCGQLTGELYFPDKMEYVGEYAFNYTKFTDIHTSIKPFYFGKHYNDLPDNLNTMWFRGEDDRDTVQVDGATYGWQTFFDVFGPASGNIPKLYIENTVKHLTSQTYWKQYTDITFLGPNVITLDRTEIFFPLQQCLLPDWMVPTM